jgi:hypothetical protein
MLRAVLAVLLFISQAQAGSLTLLGAGKPPTAAATNVTVDHVGTTKYQASSNNFNYTGLTITGGLTNPGLVCYLIRVAAALDVTTGIAVTWNGTAMTLRKTQIPGTDTFHAVFLFGLRNPTSGSQTLNVSGTNVATDNFVNCVSFSNVNQASDAAAFPNPAGTNSAATLDITSAAGHIAVGVFDFGSVGGTILGTTVINDQSSGTFVSAGADYVVSSGGTTTVGTSVNQTNIAGMDVSN